MRTYCHACQACQAVKLSGLSGLSGGVKTVMTVKHIYQSFFFAASDTIFASFLFRAYVRGWSLRRR